MIKTGRNLCSQYFPLEKSFVDQIESNTQIKVECYLYTNEEKFLHKQIYQILLLNLLNFEVLGSNIQKHSIFNKINQIFWNNFKMGWKNHRIIRSSSELHSINIQGYLKLIENEESILTIWDYESVLLLGSS